MKRVIHSVAVSVALATAIVASPAKALTQADLVGTQVSPAEPHIVRVVDESTRSIRVRHGETVELVMGDRSITWRFDGLSSNIKLEQILSIPSNAVIYVDQSTNPLMQGS